MGNRGVWITALAGACIVTGAASAAFGGEDGRIAFSGSAVGRGDYDIHTMRPDGSQRRTLLAGRLVDLDPAWSADGARLVFVRDVDDRPASSNNEIYLEDTRTGKLTRLTTTRSTDWNPAFSPDGERIAFSSDRGPGSDFDIFVLEMDTRDITRIEREGADFAPVYSSSGLLYWSGYRSNGRADIFVLGPSPSVPRPVTTTRRESEEEPDVHPSGSKLVYHRWGEGSGADPEIVVHTIGSGTKTVLTRNGRSDVRPVFSPRGNRIAWERARDGTDVSGRIWTMRINGKHKTPRTAPRYDADSPAWQPVP